MEKNKCLVEFFLALFVTLSSMSYSTTDDYVYLNNIALEAGTDKNSNFHDYMEVYAEYFAPLKEEPIKFLEIGIYYGNSVKLWENYFPHADLHFIDSNRLKINYFSDRAQYHFLDQANMPQLDLFAKSVNGKFDVIIDDGGHTMVQQINSFKALFPYLNSGGLYIVEDLHTSYWGQYGGSGDLLKSGPSTAVGFFKDLVDDVNYTGAATGCASWNRVSDEMKKSLTPYQRDIKSITFYKSMCVIKKR